MGMIHEQNQTQKKKFPHDPVICHHHRHHCFFVLFCLFVSNRGKARRNREEVSVQLRRTAREQELQSKRQRPEQLGVASSSAAAVAAATSSSSSTTPNAAAPATPATISTAPSTAIEIKEITESLAKHAHNILRGTAQEAYISTTMIRKVLSAADPPIQAVVDTGIVPRLATLLSMDDAPNLQYEAAWALTNVASGNQAQTRAVIEAGGIDAFARLIDSSVPEVREQAIWGLGNIAADDTRMRDVLLKQRPEVVKKLVMLVSPTARLELLRVITWVFSNLCREKPAPPFEAVQPILRVARHLLYSVDKQILHDTCITLSFLSDDQSSDNAKIQAVVDADVVPRLSELLEHQDRGICEKALRTIGNIATGDQMQTQCLVDSSVLPRLMTLAMHPARTIRRETCWCISNITAGTPEQIQAVIDASLLPPLIGMLRASEMEIKREALWAITNAISGGTESQIHHIAHLENNCLSALCEVLAIRDTKLLHIALNALSDVLRVGKATAKRMAENASSLTDAVRIENEYATAVEECGGLTKIEKLQTHENADIYKKSVDILREYFDAAAEEEDEENEDQQQQHQQQHLAFGDGKEQRQLQPGGGATMMPMMSNNNQHGPYVPTSLPAFMPPPQLVSSSSFGMSASSPPTMSSGFFVSQPGAVPGGAPLPPSLPALSAFSSQQQQHQQQPTPIRPYDQQVEGTPQIQSLWPSAFGPAVTQPSSLQQQQQQQPRTQPPTTSAFSPFSS